MPSRPARFKKNKSAFLQKPNILFVGDSIAHNANIANVEKQTKTRIKTRKAYSSARDNTARWPKKNVSDIVPEALVNTFEEDEFTHLVLAAPTVEITNIDTSNKKKTVTTQKYINRWW